MRRSRRQTAARQLSMCLSADVLETRCLLAVAPVESDGQLWFVSATAGQLERYHLSDEQWQTPVMLSGSNQRPTALLVDSDGIYAAYGRSVYRYSLSGSSPTRIMETDTAVQSIYSDGSLLLIHHSQGTDERFTSVDKETNSVIDQVTTHSTQFLSPQIIPHRNRILGATGHSTSSGVTLTYDDSGHFVRWFPAPYQAQIPASSRHWIFPTGTRVIDNRGSVFASDSLQYLTSLGTQIDSVTFYQNTIPIVSRGNVLSWYTNSLQPSGSMTLGFSPKELYLSASHLIAMISDSQYPSGYRAELIPLSSLALTDPDPMIDPAGLAFTPNYSTVTADGMGLIYSAAHQSIFLWDPALQKYARSILLSGSPMAVTYSIAENRVYLGYTRGVIRKLDLDDPVPSETEFFEFQDDVRRIRLTSAGSLLIAVIGEFGSNRILTFDSAGTKLDSQQVTTANLSYVWNESTQSIFSVQSEFDPKTILRVTVSGTGNLVEQTVSSLATTEARDATLHVSPNGEFVILSSGAIYDSATLSFTKRSLFHRIHHIVWLNGQMVTLRDLGPGYSELEIWSPDADDVITHRRLNGSAQSLDILPSGKLLVGTMSDDGNFQLDVFNSDLEPIVAPGSLVVSETDGQTNVAETGSIDSVFVSLQTAPQSNVTINVTVKDATEVSVDQTSLLFTPANWHIPQRVNVRGVDD
ncbi:MAG: hypothetical protein JNL58_14945, partial [Planctomyces sp.]|nr:hypothetical protein [Planctomyces sp.]